MTGASPDNKTTEPKQAFSENARVVNIIIKGWEVPEEHRVPLYDIIKAGIDFEGDEDTVREKAQLVTHLVTDMRQEAYAGYGDDEIVAVKLLEHFDRRCLGNRGFSEKACDDFVALVKQSIKYCNDCEIDYGFKEAPKPYLNQQELIGKAEEKLVELFKQGIDFDDLKIVGTSEAFTVAEVIDWYKGFVGLPYIKAASALHEKMEEAGMLEIDTLDDFLVFVEKCGDVAQKSNVIPDGSLPEFLWVYAGYDVRQHLRDREVTVMRSIDLG